jgi:phage terminase large subunit
MEPFTQPFLQHREDVIAKMVALRVHVAKGTRDEDRACLPNLRDETGETIDNLRQALEDDRRLVAQSLMTQEEFEQEWYCSFEAAIKGAYYAKEISAARRENRITAVPYDKALLVHTVWDLGKGQNMAVGFYQKFGNQTRKIDYWEGANDDGLPEAIAAVKAKLYLYGKHFAPHDIRAVDLSTGKSRWETAKNLGIKFEIVPDIGVDNGIQAGKLMFSRLWVDSVHCSRWLDSVSQYRQEWDEKRGMFKDVPLHDWTSHGADEYRYAAIIEEQMRNEINRMPLPTTGLVKPFYPEIGV